MAQQSISLPSRGRSSNRIKQSPRIRGSEKTFLIHTMSPSSYDHIVLRMVSAIVAVAAILSLFSIAEATALDDLEEESHQILINKCQVFPYHPTCRGLMSKRAGGWRPNRESRSKFLQQPRDIDETARGILMRKWLNSYTNRMMQDLFADRTHDASLDNLFEEEPIENRKARPVNYYTRV